MKYLLCLLFPINMLFVAKAQSNEIILDSSLIIKPLTKNTYIHISYLPVKGYGPFPCNGLIHISQGNAFIFDTPVNDSLTALLIDWIQDSLKVTVAGVIVNHFHEDCLGGLKEVHRRNIRSFAHKKCIALAKKNGETIPVNGFGDLWQVEPAHFTFECRYPGEAHTPDNIVCWIPDEKILFGGCMVKAMNAGKGNLADANVESWPETIKKVKNYYPAVEIVVPGHGEPGGIELLDYTIQLFTP